MTGHTPGPWSVYCNDSRGYKTGICASSDQLPPGDECIAQIWAADDRHFPGGVPEAEANARLIAAAPDLVQLLDDVSAALETALAHFGKKMHDADFRSRSDLCVRARRLCDKLLRPEEC